VPFLLADASTTSPPPAPPAVVAEQPAADTLYPPDAIGLGVSWVSGSGLVYRHWVDETWGFQLGGIPYVQGTFAFVNFGGQIMYRAIKRYPYQFSPLLGIGYAYNKNSWFVQNGEKTDIGLAPGVQLEYALNRNLWAYAHIGYTMGAQITTGATPSADFRPGGGLGMFFAF